MNGHRAIAAIAALALLGLPWRVEAASNAEVAAANALYTEGSYEAALETYTRLLESHPERAELEFNRGAAAFQLGDVAAAREAFERAALLSDDPALQALSAYNMGNCNFAEAQQKVGEDPEAAIASLNQSVRYYKDALARNRALPDAAHNMETAKLVIQQLREQMQQQQEEQQRQEEEMKEKLDEIIEEQERQNQQTKQAAEQQQDPTQVQPDPSEMEEMSQEQGQTREKTEELAEEMQSGEGGQDSPADAAKQHAEAAAEKQAEAEEHLKNGDPQQANAAQEKALEELKQAREALEGEEQEGEKQPGEEQEGEPSGDGESEPQDPRDPSGEPRDQQAQNPQSPEEMDAVPPPDATARDILNQEQRQKEQRALQQMIRVRPVEKDW